MGSQGNAWFPTRTSRLGSFGPFGLALAPWRGTPPPAIQRTHVGCSHRSVPSPASALASLEVLSASAWQAVRARERIPLGALFKLLSICRCSSPQRAVHMWVKTVLITCRILPRRSWLFWLRVVLRIVGVDCFGCVSH